MRKKYDSFKEIFKKGPLKLSPNLKVTDYIIASSVIVVLVAALILRHYTSSSQPIGYWLENHIPVWFAFADIVIVSICAILVIHLPFRIAGFFWVLFLLALSILMPCLHIALNNRYGLWTLAFLCISSIYSVFGTVWQSRLGQRQKDGVSGSRNDTGKQEK